MNNTDAKNWDFFNRSSGYDAQRVLQNETHDGQPFAQAKVNADEEVMRGFVQADAATLRAIKGTRAALMGTGLSKLRHEVETMERNLQSGKFRISVVGEFSKGKSSFINRLFGRELLPVGNLPTTAILTKITYNPREMIVYIDSIGAQKALPLAATSWEGLTAQIDQADPKGVAFVGVNSPWLAQTGIEIVDTPGAGDLNEKRALLINDALMCGDAAIITISALQPLSISEKDFITQRLIAAKMPRLILIVTHLDQVHAQERASVIRFIQNKLSLWELNVPIFIPYDGLEIPDMETSVSIGIEPIKAEIGKWISDAEHQARKRESVCTQLLAILNIAKSSIAEQGKLLSLDKEKRDEVLEQKKMHISKIQLIWEDLRLEVLKRGVKCYEWLCEAVREKEQLLVERLQYEASHTNNPQKWWEEDYPYRLKIELMSLATSLESGLTQVYANDVRWLNDVLDKQFRLSIFVGKDVIADKSLFRESASSADIEFENLEKKRMWVRIGTGAATVAGFALFAASGMLPIVATIGIGTGGALISEKLFKGKIERQHSAIKEALAMDVPRVIDNALAVAEQRLQESYKQIAIEASAQEELWTKAQLEALEIAKDNAPGGKAEELAKMAKSIDAIILDISTLAGENA